MATRERDLACGHLVWVAVAGAMQAGKVLNQSIIKNMLHFFFVSSLISIPLPSIF